MTIAAPPEKMLLDELVKALQSITCYNVQQAEAVGREAARRLAPRVGDDDLWLCLDLAIRRLANWVPEHDEQIKRARDLLSRSAPPAASADEMELEAHILTFFPDNPHSAKACALTYIRPPERPRA